MKKLRGLTLKTFIYTLTLVLFVLTVSLGILYYVLPNFYFMQKNRVLEKNTNTLEISLNKAQSKEECATLILDFSKRNNANIASFDSSGLLIFDLSSPILLMNESEKESQKFTYIRVQKKVDDTENNRTEDRFAINVGGVSEGGMSGTEIDRKSVV